MLSRNIIHFRQSLRWSQQELAQKAGITQSKLARLEKGKTELTYDEMIRMAGALGVSIADLVAENPGVTPKIILTKESMPGDNSIS